MPDKRGHLALLCNSQLQDELLRWQNFQEKCASWTAFLQSMEDCLAVPIAGSYSELRAQLRVHQVTPPPFPIVHDAAFHGCSANAEQQAAQWAGI